MCRFLAYLGPEVRLADLISRSERSLIRQSYRALERPEPLNGDGFGIGWYEPTMGAEPCVFTSVTPAWSNRNLARLAEKVDSPCVFAHVRAASPGSVVTELNCHPFQRGRLLWMHNGNVADFKRIKRTLRSALSDESYDAIEGSTDSEHAFAVFLDRLGDRSGIEALRTAMVETSADLDALAARFEVTAGSDLNFAVTDGESLVVQRRSTAVDRAPQTLYVARDLPGLGTDTVVVASEPVTERHDEWHEVPPDHLVLVNAQRDVEIVPLSG